MSDSGGEAHGSAGEPDVRQHVAWLLTSSGPSIDDIDWGQFQHAYGAADDVPDLLRGLWAPDRQQASASLSALWEQGAPSGR